MPRHASRPLLIVVCAPLILLLVRSPLRAEFQNGVERFNGSTLDLNTWVPFDSTGMTQSGSLTIDIPDGSTDLTTRTLTAGVGDVVQADVRVNAYNAVPGSLGGCGIYLTNNSRGTTATADLDSQFLTVFNLELGVIMASASGGPGTAPVLVNNMQPVGATYTYRITRLSSASARFEVLSGTTVIASQTRQFQGVDDELSVSLYASSINATFDNVVVTPEPAAGAVLAFGPLFLRRRRRPVAR